MPDRSDLIYTYDGSFAGFLCCVFESYAKKEIPRNILASSGQPGLFDFPKWIETNPLKAERVYESIPRRISAEAQELVKLGFLTCAPQKELLIFRFLQLGYKVGGRAMSMLTDDRVYPLQKAVRQLTCESHKFTGFIRFTVFATALPPWTSPGTSSAAGEAQTAIWGADRQAPQAAGAGIERGRRNSAGAEISAFPQAAHPERQPSHEVLVAVIEPKSFVLPLLAAHFCERFRNEMFMIYDKTHNSALIYQRGKAEILQIDNLALPEVDKEEAEYRRLWKRFYETIAIESRYNPRCRMTLMPKRYWKNMMEFS